MKKARKRGMVRRMTDKTFEVNDKQLAIFLKNHGIKLIEIKNGKYIFEYDASIEENLKAFEELQGKCMF